MYTTFPKLTNGSNWGIWDLLAYSLLAARWCGLQPTKKSMSSVAVTASSNWKQLLLNALDSNSHLKHSSFLQLATVASNGRPSNRTVVFRGFQDNTDRIQIHTDSRSRKIAELKHNPFAEICWYFTDSWEQFRINGRVEVIDEANTDKMKLQQRGNAWFSASVRSRLQYLGAAPGVPRLYENAESKAPESCLDASAGPVDAFCLLVLDPDQVDYLNLKSNQRVVFTSTTQIANTVEKFWASETINP